MARDAKRDFEDNRLAWRKLAAGFEVHIVPGTHTSMREEPHVAELAAKLRSCLEALLQELNREKSLLDRVLTRSK
jgi:thioesterase domain-containing protein